eukprot:TRINITY_DN33504_c0_g1_i2.p1 TRINITY_DN33504_c0_g1~~TRINITY_DN33504_c0_g1_i2.p1  ORF type:complete len:371 (+),score=86.62 TRINITY_DN33504_c0_g1_i2:59-1114(+)
MAPSVSSLLARPLRASTLAGRKLPAGSRWQASGSRAASSLASLVHKHAASSPSQLALLAPQQDIRWDYSQLSANAKAVAATLAKLGYGQGDVVATDLPNCAENLVLQVAASHLGAAVATAKDAKALAELGSKVSLKGVVTHSSEGATEVMKSASLPASTVVLPALDGSLGNLVSGTDASQAPAAFDAEAAAALGYWSSTKPLTNGEALDTMGKDAADFFKLTPADRVLVTITLCHAFGIGSAVGGALQAGATVVLPGASGIRGCGSPSQRAEVSLQVLASEKCSIMFADIHTLKALPAPGAADISTLRGGACKVGSGADFLEHVMEAKLGPDGEMRPLEYAGVKITAVGKK